MVRESPLPAWNQDLQRNVEIIKVGGENYSCFNFMLRFIQSLRWRDESPVPILFKPNPWRVISQSYSSGRTLGYWLPFSCSASWHQETGKQSPDPHAQHLWCPSWSLSLCFKNVPLVSLVLKHCPHQTAPDGGGRPLWPLQTSRASIPCVSVIKNFMWHWLHAWFVSSFG